MNKKQSSRSDSLDNNNVETQEKSVYRDAKIFIDQILELNKTENMNFNNEDVVADTNLLISAVSSKHSSNYLFISI